MKHTLLALLGAVIGGTLGFFLSGWFARQGLYTVLVPGALMGLGSLIGRFPRWFFAIPMALIALCLGYFTEWHYFPFAKDNSLSFFVSKIGSLKPITHIMVILGAVISGWVSFRSVRKT